MVPSAGCLWEHSAGLKRGWQGRSVVLPGFAASGGDVRSTTELGGLLHGGSVEGSGLNPPQHCVPELLSPPSAVTWTAAVDRKTG